MPVDFIIAILPSRGLEAQSRHLLQGHSDVSTTMVYTHVLDLAGGDARSPLDSLLAS